ncbi:hypothetical protein ARMSODRAFT_1023563 [Armillaria solidipes]|uniref:Uncharacterized protein n=1 Tax=Armillaria solidipes TaxID=1076256 RepID=A0A2H3BJ87_9AGAR|nr:hypothetical protein ARMSODRAFT_1023563 [Armillaria solidipes]
MATSGFAPVVWRVPGVEMMYKPLVSGILAMTLASGRGVRIYMGYEGVCHFRCMHLKVPFAYCIEDFTIRGFDGLRVNVGIIFESPTFG